ncbi:MarR family winged helix-turn-helix transcriptional regulator [Thalassotalea sp. PP2-459]|uniref:MarR family winged helix-turn-helix transcriptional regulator n=1 Tax=Thalassotalea sp. PP2-459 TaxID=1742724 RepID=UPI0009432EED|nr:MarR family winged helix-turn-helix transcriptional regulator [Thalassotalea sp. PP2-459]OKY27923.1 MarR family transcriptional regulator [Thalassotalea sp. PP2-459]
MIKSSARRLAFQLTTEHKEPLDLTNHLPFQIAVVSNLLALNRDWKIRNLSDLDPREMRVLLNIGSYMPIKSADIAYQSRLDSYTVSRAVKKLLSLDLIESQPDQHKKNVKNLVLNERGLTIYKHVTAAMDERSKQLESVLTEEEKASFYQMLAKIEDKAEQLLAEQAKELIAQGEDAPADQKELIRWRKKSKS